MTPTDHYRLAEERLNRATNPTTSPAAREVLIAEATVDALLALVGVLALANAEALDRFRIGEELVNLASYTPTHGPTSGASS